MSAEHQRMSDVDFLNELGISFEGSSVEDRGVIKINQMLLEAAATINTNGRDKDPFIPQLVEVCDKQWPYMDKVVKFTGRIYVADAETVKYMNTQTDNLYGKPLRDPYGYYYNVENMPLVSQGISVCRIRSDEDMAMGGDDDYDYDIVADEGDRDITFTYAYAFGEHGEAAFYTIPGELGIAEYPFATFHEVELRLETRFEEVKKYIDAHLDKDERDYQKIVIVLRDLPLEKDGCSHEDMELIAQYVAYRIGFDPKWPAITQFQGNGEQKGTDSDGDAIVTDVSFNDELPIVRRPMGVTVIGGKGTLDYGIVFVEPQPLDMVEDGETTLHIPASSIQEFVSLSELATHTRIRAALANMALDQDRFVEEDDEVDDREIDTPPAEIPSEVAIATRVYNAYQTCRDLIRDLTIPTYVTREAAEQAGDALTEDIEGILEDTPHELFTYVAEGKGVELPNVRITQEMGDRAGDVIIRITQPTDDALRRPEPGEVIYGRNLSLVVKCEELGDDTYVLEARYIINRAGTDNDRSILLGGLPLIDTSVRSSILIDPLETDLVPLPLRVRQQRKKSIGGFHGKYPASPVGKVLDSIDSIMDIKPLGSTIEIENARVLYEIATASQDDAEQTDDILAVLKSCLKHRPVVIDGRVYPGDVDSTITSEVIDFLPSAPHHDISEPVVVLGTPHVADNNDMYVPLSTITRLRIR